MENVVPSSSELAAQLHLKGVPCVVMNDDSQTRIPLSARVPAGGFRNGLHDQLCATPPASVSRGSNSGDDWKKDWSDSRAGPFAIQNCACPPRTDEHRRERALHFGGLGDLGRCRLRHPDCQPLCLRNLRSSRTASGIGSPSRLLDKDCTRRPAVIFVRPNHTAPRDGHGRQPCVPEAARRGNPQGTMPWWRPRAATSWMGAESSSKSNRTHGHPASRVVAVRDVPCTLQDAVDLTRIEPVPPIV